LSRRSTSKRLYACQFVDEPLYTRKSAHGREREETVVTSVSSGSQETGGTLRDTLDLRRRGETVSDIPTVRGMSLGAIKRRLSRWIADGEVSVHGMRAPETTRSSSLLNAAAGAGHGLGYDGNNFTKSTLMASV
jgi:hypothetical protein